MAEPNAAAQTATGHRSMMERVEDAVLTVNPDIWLVSLLAVVAIRCLGGFA